jgi:hypothetical protein
MSEDLYLNPDGTLDTAKVESYSPVPPGNYVVKLVDIKVTEPGQWADGSAKNAQLEATWEIVEGRFTGRTIRYWYSLDVKPGDKPGDKVKAKGISDILVGIDGIGAPKPERLPIKKPMEMRKLFAQNFGKKRLDVALTERKGTGEYAGKVYTNFKIVGIAGAAKGSTSNADLPDDEPIAQPSASTSDDFA